MAWTFHSHDIDRQGFTSFLGTCEHRVGDPDLEFPSFAGFLLVSFGCRETKQDSRGTIKVIEARWKEEFNFPLSHGKE